MCREFDEMLEQRNVPGHVYLNEIQEEVSKVEDFLVRQRKEFDGIRDAKNKMILSASLLMTLAKCTNTDTFQRGQHMLVESSGNLQYEERGRKSISKL